ncbi:hypothetical protein AB0K15_01135 [Amycolatopsis sp. NPDC049253]|uniref:hypothetical protein n=1 Tax=Amycolatopsis sp. NPDC049253 TaxID=3155274 RepID=UPI003449D68D
MSDQVPPEQSGDGGTPQDAPVESSQAAGAAGGSGEDARVTAENQQQAVGAGGQPAPGPQQVPPGRQQPGAPQPGMPQPGMPQQPYGQQPPPGAWGAPQPARRPGGFRRFVGNRVTQLVGVGVLGLLVGGGIVGGVMAATQHDGRPGMSHFRDGGGGGYREFRGGPGFGQGGPGGPGGTGTSNGTGTGYGI